MFLCSHKLKGCYDPVKFVWRKRVYRGQWLAFLFLRDSFLALFWLIKAIDMERIELLVLQINISAV